MSEVKAKSNCSKMTSEVASRKYEEGGANIDDTKTLKGSIFQIFGTWTLQNQQKHSVQFPMLD